MRFNSKELACLAQEGSEKFEKEGILYMKQKNEKLFRKGEDFVERFFRLRGNLLFYFKNKNTKPEPLGLLILERCAIELDLNEQQHFSFLIVFEGDEPTYSFFAKTEAERDSWIQVLHVASYECLKMQLQSLREQVQSKTGQDPLSQILPSDSVIEFETQAGGSVDDPAMEISMAIDGLPNDSNGQPPNPFVVVYSIVPPQQQTWLQHSHTEMVEKNNNPQFLKTIGFGDSKNLEPCTRVKVTVFHVKERMTGTMSQMGQVIFTLNDILMSSDMSIQLSLSGPDTSKVGQLSIVAWLNESTGPMVSIDQLQEDVFSADAPIRSSSAVRRRSKRLDTLRPIGENITTRTFRFETNETVKLLVHEYMAESKFTYDLPIKLLKLYIEEEKTRINQLQDLGKLSDDLTNLIEADISFRANTIVEYTENVNLLACYRGPAVLSISGKPCNNFKPSTKKADKELEFVPLNLHLQRMTVLNESTNKSGCYDTVTVGAFTAHARKYRHGGLTKSIQQQAELYTPEGTLSKVTKVSRACSLVNTLFELQVDILKLCDRVCHQSLQGDGDSLLKATEDLATKVKELVLECESPILQETAAKLADVHEEYEAIAEEQDRAKSLKMRPGDRSPEKAWKWTGSCFVKSPTVEPWDMTRVNTEAALVCLTSMVEDLVLNKSGTMDRPKWLGEISPAVIKLKSFIEIVCQKATHFMSFLDLMEHKDNLKVMHVIKCRRDVVFSQSLTSLVTAFVCHVNSHIADTTVMNQILMLGVVAEIEGLLSCHGEDMGFIEDMIVGADDLSTVTFRFVVESPQKTSIELTTNNFKRSGLYPDLNRHHVCVEVPMKKQNFDLLPQKLQQGSEVKVIPVFFNVGINELATLAERFGNTGAQDKLNEESMGRLDRYVNKYKDIPEFKDSCGSGVGSVPDLMQQLHYNVYTKKSKNVEILHLAAELCRKLHGLRFTCCKSAKDRTAMSVTLEQVQILQKEHNLASHVFKQSLDCFRSEGVRRENAYKNIGHRKYALNSLQLLSFPKQYRPPNGTYGNVQN